MKKHYFILAIFLSLTSQIHPQDWFWQNPLPQGNSLTSVCFIDENNAVAVGYSGSIIKTTDGGNNWKVQTSSTSSHLLGVSFTDVQNGTAVVLHAESGIRQVWLTAKSSRKLALSR